MLRITNQKNLLQKIRQIPKQVKSLSTKPPQQPPAAPAKTAEEAKKAYPSGLPKQQTSSSSAPLFLFLTIVASSGLLLNVAYEKKQGVHVPNFITSNPYFLQALEPFSSAVDVALEAPQTLDNLIPDLVKPYLPFDLKTLVPAPKKVEQKPVKEEIKVEVVEATPEEVISEADEVVLDAIIAELEEEEKTPEPPAPEAPAVVVIEEVTPEPVVSEPEPVPEPVIIPEPVIVEVIPVEPEHLPFVPVEIKSGLPVVSSEQTMTNRVTSVTVGDVLTSVAQNSLALRHELESALLRDIHTMDAGALRIRITQLASELFERLSWESIRLSQSVKQVESELTVKYEDLMVKQRKELEFELNKILFERERELVHASEARINEIETRFQVDLQNAIKAQAEGFQETLTKELENQGLKIFSEAQDQVNHIVARLRQSHADVLLQNQTKYEQLAADLDQYQSIVETAVESIEVTADSNAMSVAVLALEFILSNNSKLQPAAIGSHFKKLEVLSTDDTLLTSVLKSIPARVKSEGSLSFPELQVRFAVLKEEVRKSALAPEAAPKLVGQFIGTVLANIARPPAGYVTGNGVEETLARAQYYLDRGDLESTVKELNTVTGYEQKLMKDWKEYAQERLIVDQALRILKADALVKHVRFSTH